MHVTEEGKGEIDPSRSINCSHEPLIGKLFCANKRDRTSFVSPETSIRCSVGHMKKNEVTLGVKQNLQH